MTSGLKESVGNGTSVVLLTLVVIFDDVTIDVTFGEFEVFTMTGFFAMKLSLRLTRKV